MLFYKAVIFKINNTTFHQRNFSGISLYLITSNKVQIGFQLKNFFFFISSQYIIQVPIMVTLEYDRIACELVLVFLEICFYFGFF